MEEFIWQDAYHIDNKTIDAEHRHLLELANRVIRFRASGERLEVVRKAIVALSDYIQTHFAHEESCMAQARYPGLPAHRVLHEAIIYEMSMIIRGSADLDILVPKLKELMQSWVVDHIQEADRQVGDFLRTPPPATEPPASR